MKKIISLVAFLAMTLVTPVNADISPRVSGNGYSYGKLKHNGIDFDYYHSFYNDGSGLGVSFDTDAYIVRQHSSVKGVFRTFSHGLDTNYSSAVTRGPLSGPSYAISVFSQYSDPTGIDSGEASTTALSTNPLSSTIRITY